jgi:signal transduction histidine kinase
MKGLERLAANRLWVRRLLRVPLVAKIAGANGLIVVATLVVALSGVGLGHPVEARFLVLLASALGLSLMVSVALALLALRPLEDLVSTAQRIWRGDLLARVPTSALADADVQRVGGALNVLLDGLIAERARLRALAAQVISAGDRERAAIARELHDSTAQSLAALLLELHVLAREAERPELAERVFRIRQIVSEVLDEVKLLAHTVHPRVLDDLGLRAALRLLAREAEERTHISVEVDADATADKIEPTHTSVLYRVAQEAMNNAIRHARAERVVLRVAIAGGVARLEVIDDGVGFDLAEAEERRPGMGLFTMRERAALVGGAAEVFSEMGKGTRVIATVPARADGVPVSAAAPAVPR